LPRSRRPPRRGTIQWGPDGVTLCSATGAQIRPAIVSDGEGGVLVFRADSTGTVLWDQTAADTTTLGIKLVLAESDNGGAIVAWQDRRIVNHWQVFAQKLPLVVLAIEDRTPSPAAIELSVHPNPYSASTEIRFWLPSPSDTSLQIYDVHGRRIATRR